MTLRSGSRLYYNRIRVFVLSLISTSLSALKRKMILIERKFWDCSVGIYQNSMASRLGVGLLAWARFQAVSRVQLFVLWRKERGLTKGLDIKPRLRVAKAKQIILSSRCEKMIYYVLLPQALATY